MRAARHAHGHANRHTSHSSSRRRGNYCSERVKASESLAEDTRQTDRDGPMNEQEPLTSSSSLGSPYGRLTLSSRIYTSLCEGQFNEQQQCQRSTTTKTEPIALRSRYITAIRIKHGTLGLLRLVQRGEDRVRCPPAQYQQPVHRPGTAIGQLCVCVSLSLCLCVQQLLLNYDL